MVGDDDRIGAGVGGHAGVVGVEDAFQDQLAAPLIADAFDLFPIELRVELFVGPGGQAAEIAHAFRVSHDVAEGAAGGGEHAQGPLRFQHHVKDIGQGQPGRGGQAVLQVLVALAEDLQIKRQHKGRAVCLARPFDQGIDEILVAHDVKLEPEGGGRVFGHIFDRADRHGGEREGHAKGGGGAGGLDLAIGGLHPARADGRKGDRHGHLLADHGAFGGAAGQVAGDALAQADLGEIADVVAEGLFGVAAGFRVIVEHLGGFLGVDRLEIVDAGDDSHSEPPILVR